MTVYAWPSTIKTGPVDYAIEFNPQITIARNGRVTTYGLPGARWTASVRFENDVEVGLMRPRIEAMMVRLEGGAHRLQFGHFARSVPNGTLTGSPALGAAVSPGAYSLSINNANGGLLEGDIIGLPGQMVMVMADANPVITNLTVSVKPAIRAAHALGTPVTWNRPATLWIPRSNVAGPFPYTQNKGRPGFSVDFVEAWL